MEQYVTRIGDVTIQRVIPSGGGPPEPVRVMESEELLRAVKEEPIDEDEEEGEGEEENDEEAPTEGEEGEGNEGKDEEEGEVRKEAEEEEEELEGEEEDEEQEKIIIKQEPQDDDLLDEVAACARAEQEQEEDDDEGSQKEIDDKEDEREGDNGEEAGDNDKGESTKRKADGESEEDSESASKKKKVEIDVDLDKKKISNLRRNIREVMDETQLDEATLAAQRQEAERLRRVQDQQKYIREVQRHQIQLNRQNSKTQSRVISLLQGGSTSILKSSAAGTTTSSTSTGPSTVLVKVGSGQQQILNRKTLEVLRGGKSVSSSTEPVRSGITRVTPGNRPAMVTPSVSIAPVKPVVQSEGQKKVSNDADVVTISSSSDSEDDCIVISGGEDEEEEEEEEDPTNSGMHTNDMYNIPDEQGRVLINVGKPESEPEIFLAPQIARVIKPHQIGGVRFLFDNVVESLERFNDSPGFGCILAHSMGLGKTLQVVSFCDVFLRETSAKTVMCIMPINTLQNWVAEFNMWLPTDPTNSPLAVHGEVRPRHFGIYILNDLHKTIASRAKVVEEWNREGGVLLIGYEMYRQLSLKRPGRARKSKKKQPEEDVEDEKHKPLLEAMHEALVRPGPDLVICDEGHRIKNSHASISHALKQIRTKRRIVLTGYPLQNNLLEYWCMVDFVRPNYLGTKTEFSNMFERPIQNGQCIDSTPQDIRLMRYRAHVLHSLLEGFVQRRSHSVLRNSLPQKEEYVLLVRMTSFQRKLYDTFMNEVVRTKAVPNPLKAFAVCCKIWNHPDILYNFLKKKEMDELQDLDLEETAALHPATGPNSPRRPLAKEKKGKKEVKKAQVAPIKPEVTTPMQTQPPTPDIKQEERKFDFPNSQQPPPPGPHSGPPGYDYYPPPPPYSDMYQFHRPPGGGMYYPGYNQDYPPGYYHGYDQNYPGYYGNFGGPMDSFSGPPKNEDFSKQPPPNWNAPFGNVKQEKNPSKSPKDFEASAKPGFQEFYPVKEEKPDIKEEKQSFLCGFTGGQVSYNYRNYPGGYPNYPYPPQEYPAWNKEGFQPFPQDPNMQGGQPPMPGGQDRPSGAPSGNAGNPPGMFGDPNQSENQHRLSGNQERPSNHPQNMTSQGTQHNTPLDRGQHNQNSGDSHMSKNIHQRPHSTQDHLGGNQNVRNPQENVHMNMSVSQSGDDQQRLSNEDHMNPSHPGMYSNQRNDGIPDSVHKSQGKNRNSQENEPKRKHSNSQINNQQNVFNPNNLYGNKGASDDYRIPNNIDNISGSQQGSFSQINNKGIQHQASQPGMENQHSRMHGNNDPNTLHPQNPYNNQRNDSGVHGGIDHHVQNQDRMPSIHQNFYGNQENQQNFHDNRLHGNQDFASNQHNLFESKRIDHNYPPNQDQGNQHGGNQQMTENARRPSIGQENMYGNQRSDVGPQGPQEHGQINQQTLHFNQDKQEVHQRSHSSQERHSVPQQMFGNQRPEHPNQESFSGNQNKHDSDPQSGNQNSKTSNQQKNFPSQRNTDIGVHPNQEQMQNNQQNMGILQESPQRMSSSHDRMHPSLSTFGNQETMQGNPQAMFRGQSPHDSSHRMHSNQQNFYGNQFMDHGMHSGNEQHLQNSQTNLNNQNIKSNNKRVSSSDHISGTQPNLYGNQSDHSVQKMIKTDSHNEKQQLLQHATQDRQQNQFNMFSSTPENPYNNPEHHTGRQNIGENQNMPESSYPPHVNRDRLQGAQGINPNQDRKQVPTQGGMFNNQNMPDSRWMHSNQEHGPGQQNIYDHGQQSREDSNQGSQDKQRQFHGNQDYTTHSQQNLYGSQSNQSNLTRNSEQIHGKQSNVMGAHNVHENQYRINSGQDTLMQERHQFSGGLEGKSNNQETMHGGSHSRQNAQDHSLHNQEHMQNAHGNQPMQRNVSVGMQSNSDQNPGQHGMMGGVPGKHGMHTNADPSHSNPHGMGNIPNSSGSNHPGVHPQGGIHGNQDNLQNLSNYGTHNTSQQKPSGHELHQSNQQNMPSNQPGSLINQNISRPQHGVGNSQDAQNNQQMGAHSDGQLGMYGNQFHMPGDQHSMKNQSPHSNKNTHQMQPNIDMPGQNMSMFGNQMPMQGNSQGSNTSNQGMLSHVQNQNISQGMHGSAQAVNTGQGIHGTNPMPHGSLLGSQHHMNHPSNQQYQPGPNGPPVSPMMQGNHGGTCNQGPPSYPGSQYGNQFMPNPNQQNMQMNPHNPQPEHLQSNQQSNLHKISGSQHNFQQNSPHNKNQATPTKHDAQKIQTSPLQNTPPHSHVSQQGTQTGGDNSLGQNTGNQHRIQNMLNYSPGHHQPNPSFEQNIILSNKGMSGGQVLQGSPQQKHGMQNVHGKGDDQNRFRSNFDEQFPPGSENYQGNYQKPGFYEQDFQYPFQQQYPFQDNHFSEQPGPSGQMFRKEDEKRDDDNKSKEGQKDGDENSKTNTSTNTETDEERKDKRDEEDKSDKKQDKIDVTPTTTPQKSGKEDPGIPYDWATEILKGYVPGDINASGKMAVFFCILEESIALGDRILVFSQSLFTLNLMEELLQQQLIPGRECERWAKNVNYYRLDGSTTAMEREKLINEFNSNANLHLFLVSTRAGSLGINLVGANRVIVFDASWNPCHDTQAVCRVYRYGQKKPCFVYRLVTDNCLEKKIYDRQINKQGMSDRVVDECNPDAHLSIKEVTSLCWDDKEDDTPKDFSKLQDSYIDVVLQKVIQKHAPFLSKEPFAHESLLVDRKEKKLSQAEKRMAKRSYELEKQASTRTVYNGVQQNQVRPKPMASVRPMQAEMGQAGRQRGWIPASVWQRQGMSAQEMTLPLDVVIPTNAADRASIVLKAGQKVMVLKSPKGIYMQLENGKIIAIRTAFKVGGKKPGEQGKGPIDLNQRRGIRQQLGAGRGRPVRAVGPVTRPPPVTVTVTRKRPSEDEQTGRRDDESRSPSTNSPGTPMEVTVTPAEKEGPNPFTAAAAPSLSNKQCSASDEQMDTFEQGTCTQTSESQISEKEQHSPSSQPQATVSPQPQVTIQPLPSKPLSSQQQVTVQPMVQNKGVPQSPVQPHLSHPPQSPLQSPSQISVQPQPLTPMQSPPMMAVQSQPQAPMQTQPQVPMQSLPQVPMQSQPQVPLHSQPQAPMQSQTQVPMQSQPQAPMQSQPQAQMQSQPQIPMQSQMHQQQQMPMQSLLMQNQPQVSMQSQAQVLPLQPQPQGPMQAQMQGGMPSPTQGLMQAPQTTPSQSQTPTAQPQSQPSVPPQPQQPPVHPQQPPIHPQQPPIHPQQQVPIQPHPQAGAPQQQSPVHPHYSMPPQSPNQFPMQTSHHPQSSPFSLQPQSQKSTHYPDIPQHQFPLPPQQSQFPMGSQPLSRYIGHPSSRQPPSPFPMHPQPQYPVQAQQSYPVQPQPQYPLQPHLQQPQYPPQPPHQFPMLPQYPVQPPPSQFEPPPPSVPPSMITDQLS